MVRKRRKGSGSSSEECTVQEWIGGRLATPFEVASPRPHCPDIVLWMALPEGRIAHDAILDSEAPLDFAASLREAMARSAVSPRSVTRVRVARAEWAEEIRAAFGSDLDVVVAPTPELDDFLAAMLRPMPAPDDHRSYLGDGRVPPEAVATLFRAASELWERAPWEAADDDQVVRVDIPRLGIRGACLSIIGALGQSYGFLLFPSRIAYEQFADLGFGEDLEGLPDALDFGSEHLYLGLVPKAELSRTMQKEIARHRWKVASPHAHPIVERRSQNAEILPLTQADLRIATACADALSALMDRHDGLFSDFDWDRSPDTISETFEPEPDLAVTLTLERDDLESLDDLVMTPPLPPRMPDLGRNDPCHCGSGRKYKKCCLRLDEEAHDREARPHPIHALDLQLIQQIRRWALGRFGRARLEESETAVDALAEPALAVPWSVYVTEVDGRTIAEHFLEERGARSSYEERAWLCAQTESWLSVWECHDTSPGRSLVLVDLLTGEERTVLDREASRCLVKRDAILARVVGRGGEYFLVGVHSRPLPPRDAAEVVQKVRAHLNKRGAVAPARLRNADVSRHLLATWNEAVCTLDERESRPVALQNTDGDALLLTTDHFAFDPGAHAAVAAKLSAVEGAKAGDDEPAEVRHYTFTRPGNAMYDSWDNTVLGSATLSKRGLRVETNSIARADALRARIEAACGSLVRHRIREHGDPQSPSLLRDVAARHEPAALSSPEALELMRAWKARHYADWADHPLPALAGRTPRAAIRTARGRKEVDLLLRDMANHEAHLAPGEAFDFGVIRRELGLDA